MKFESVPVYTMGMRYAEKQADDVVGPGRYNVSVEDRKQGITMPKSNRKEPYADQNQMVGPGRYETNKSTLRDTGVSFKGNVSALMNREENGMPGPGQYEAGVGVENSRGYTIPKATIEHFTETGVIGPGEYDGKIIKKGKGGVSFPHTGRDDKDRLANGKLGPGAYEISRDIISKNNGSFGREKRTLVDIKNVQEGALGPGAYTLEDDTFKKGNGKGYSIVGKGRAQSANTNKVGPGQYFHEEKLGQNEVYSFPKGGRVDLYNGKPNRVGPGQYGNLRDKNFGKKGISFGKSTRDGGKEGGSGLGPGQYSSQQSKVGRPISSVGTFGTEERKIGARLEEKGSAKNIGPGYYTSKAKDKKNGWSFGKEGRDQKSLDKGGNVGPGSYNLKNGFSSKFGAFGKAPKAGADQKNNVPFYSVPASVPDVPKYLLPPKNQRKIH